MIENLAVATLLVALTVTVHFFGLMVLLWMPRSRAHALHARHDGLERRHT